MKRATLVIFVLVATIAVSFLLPKPKYESLDILSTLNIPEKFAGWKSMDVSKEFNLKDDRYNFISDVFARLYMNKNGKQLLFLILDAGNFHNPKVCYKSSGFSVNDLGNVTISTDYSKFNAKAIYMERQSAGMNLYYWLVIDKKIESWTGQKLVEFWSSLFNKKKSGLMVRLEIPVSEGGIKLGREFLKNLNTALTLEQKEYLFGEEGFKQK